MNSAVCRILQLCSCQLPVLVRPSHLVQLHGVRICTYSFTAEHRIPGLSMSADPARRLGEVLLERGRPRRPCRSGGLDTKRTDEPRTRKSAPPPQQDLQECLCPRAGDKRPALGAKRQRSHPSQHLKPHAALKERNFSCWGSPPRSS